MTPLVAVAVRSDADGPVVEARAVQLSFGATPALRGADMAVRAGEILAVIGPSGSGKSTLLHCLAGILAPDSGEIDFAGHRIDNMSEAARSTLRRDRFGFVFQFGQLVPELTAEENVALLLVAPAGPPRWRRPAPGSTGSTWTGCSGAGPVSSLVGRRSASRWPAAWSPTPRCSSPTSRPDHWTR